MHSTIKSLHKEKAKIMPKKQSRKYKLFCKNCATCDSGAASFKPFLRHMLHKRKSMPIIGLIPSDTNIGERARVIAANLGLGQALIIMEGLGEISRLNAKKLELAGADVIITRGINAEIVRSTVETPVVEVPVTGQDLATALHEAKQYSAMERPRIALLAFSSVKHDVEIFADLLDINLVTYPVINDLDFIRNQLIQAKADGAHVVVAGKVSGNIAKDLGMHALMLDSGTVALRTALLEAQTVAYARRLEQARILRLQAVVDISKSGILVVDAAGNLQAINTMARKILHLGAGAEKGKAKEVLPQPLLSICENSNEPISDELLEINGTQLLLSTDIVKLGSSIMDVIFTLQPAAAIGELESKLRKSLHARGLTCQYSFKNIWGVSHTILNTIAVAKSFAATDSPILLLGETGTGKELFAQAIHQVSPRTSGPFVAINCAALPPSLLESELFGHEEGSFTGARRNGKQGLFEMANNGTIFLDEVSEMDSYGQTRLLRVLQERCTMRIGGDKYIPVNARVIAASNKDLPALAGGTGFRQDLYYRLNTLPLKIPPLRDRSGDIDYLARKFAERDQKKYSGSLKLTALIIEALESHTWPGNVRELSGFMERLALIARNKPISEVQVTDMLCSETVAEMSFVETSAAKAIESGRPERERILFVLKKNNGHQGRTAKQLGMHRSTLQRKMKALGINLLRIPV